MGAEAHAPDGNALRRVRRRACGAPQRDARGDTALWRSPVPFVGFYPPEGVKVTENRLYTPAPPRSVDDTDYLAGVEAHKRAFAKDLENAMVPAGRLPGYFEVPTDEGWRITLELAEGRLGWLTPGA